MNSNLLESMAAINASIGGNDNLYPRKPTIFQQFMFWSSGEGGWCCDPDCGYVCGEDYGRDFCVDWCRGVCDDPDVNCDGGRVGEDDGCPNNCCNSVSQCGSNWACDNCGWIANCDYKRCCPPDNPIIVCDGTLCATADRIIDCEYGVSCPVDAPYYCPQLGGCWIEECPVTIKCYDDNDCGTDGYIGDYYCNSNNIMSSYVEVACTNPGQWNSECSASITGQKIVQACGDKICIAGVCATAGHSENVDAPLETFVLDVGESKTWTTAEIDISTWVSGIEQILVFDFYAIGAGAEDVAKDYIFPIEKITPKWHAVGAGAQMLGSMELYLNNQKIGGFWFDSRDINLGYHDLGTYTWILKEEINGVRTTKCSGLLTITEPTEYEFYYNAAQTIAYPLGQCGVRTPPLGKDW